jgi:hypothetical protein
MALSCTFTKTNEVFLFSQDLSALLVLPLPDYTLPVSLAQSRFETMIRIAGVEELTHSNRGSVGASATQWPLPWSLLGSGKALSTGEVIKKRGSSNV